MIVRKFPPNTINNPEIVRRKEIRHQISELSSLLFLNNKLMTIFSLCCQREASFHTF